MLIGKQPSLLKNGGAHASGGRRATSKPRENRRGQDLVLEAGKTKEIHIQTANVYRGTILIGKPFCPVYMGATDTRRDAWGSVEVALDWPQV